MVSWWRRGSYYTRGESELTFRTVSPVSRDRQGLTGAKPNVGEQGAYVESGQSWPKQIWEQSVIRYLLVGGTSAEFLEAGAGRVEAGVDVREQGRRGMVHLGCALRLCRQVARA